MQSLARGFLSLSVCSGFCSPLEPSHVLGDLLAGPPVRHPRGEADTKFQVVKSLSPVGGMGGCRLGKTLCVE